MDRKWKPKDGKDYSLNTHEVLDIVDKPCNVILFEHIKDYDSISDVFPRDCFDDELVGRCLINYLYTDNYGHWVGICSRMDEDGVNRIEYFDPYGSFIDEIIEGFPGIVKIEHNSDYPYLLKLLYESGDDIYYNHFPLQSHSPGSATCGRWTGYFLRNCTNTDIDEFGKIFMKASKKYKVPRDELITSLTTDLIK